MICLHIFPQNVFSHFVDIGTTRVLWEISLQWNLTGYEETEDTIIARPTFGSLVLKTSILLRNRIMEVLKNHWELMMDSNRMRDSAIQFYKARSRAQL